MNRDIKKEALNYHSSLRGKIETGLKGPLESKRDLELSYTPGVAYPCLEIEREESLAYEYTLKANTLAVITDGSAVLGLGDIGPLASLPVMEGKCLLFKRFAGVNAFPITINSQDVEEFVKTVELISQGFGGINLEDIAAPRCFEIEKRLSESLPIPVFHDDQHGTAMVILAALINALRLRGGDRPRIVISGAGAAGIATARLLLEKGFDELILFDSRGAIYEGREGLNPAKKEIARLTNKKRERGSLEELIEARDVFIGLSLPGLLSYDMVRRMAEDPVIFACANPNPEIEPELARAAGASLVATGRSDDPNQINNLLVFPGFFKGLFDRGIKRIEPSMFLRVAEALADFIKEDELSRERFIPGVFDEGLADYLAKSLPEEE